MAIHLGAQPGSKGGLAVAALYWPGQLPALLVDVHTAPGLLAAVQDIIGFAGEWGDLGGVAIGTPLTWSGEASGRRACEQRLRERLPAWVPKTWLRPPNALTGAVVLQGPALTWAMAYEKKRGLLPEHEVYETHPRASLAASLGDLKDSILVYGRRTLEPRERLRHIKRITLRLVDAGVVKLEKTAPQTADELDATVAALTALAHAVPQTGLVASELEGAPIRPVGKRSLVILSGLP